MIVDDKARNADHLLATCQGALAKLEAGYADPARRPQDDLEANFYWLAVVGARTGIGAAYADMDKVRSRRVCEQVAAQDSAAANFKRDAWPAEYRDPIDGMLRSGVSPREKCRNEFGI